MLSVAVLSSAVFTVLVSTYPFVTRSLLFVGVALLCGRTVNVFNPDITWLVVRSRYEDDIH